MSRNLQRRRRRARLVFATLVLSAQFASAQTHSFVWGFAGSTTLTECGTIGLFVSDAPINGSSVVAKPPYYMMAYEVGGIATSSPIGAVNNNLQWTVPYKSGAQLLLDIADSLGNTGGVGPQPYPVVDGTSTNCHPSKEETDVTLSTDVTALTTCDPLVLNLGGGQTPYTISLVATNAPVVTNVTLGPEDNQYTWINRGTPGSSLLATVSDATGKYAKGTGLIALSGPTDITCNNANSKSGQQQGVAPPKPPKKKSNVGAIAGGAAGGGAVLLGLMVLFAWFFIRRRKQKKSVDYWAVPTRNAGATVDESFGHRPEPETRNSGPVNQYIINGPDGTTSMYSGAGPSVTLQYVPAAAYDPYAATSSASVSGRTDSTVKTPPQSVYYAHNQPSQFGQLSPPIGPPSSVAYASSAAGSSRLPRGAGAPIVPSKLPPEPEPEIVQHRDGGAVVEIPPAYGDRMP